MNTYLYFFQSLHALRMLPARRMHGTLSGGAASRLPIETWDLLLQVTQLVAKEEFRDEMDDFTFRTLCDDCEGKIQPDMRLRWGDHPSVHRNPSCRDCYILAEPVVNQFYNNWEPMSLFLQQYHLAADWYRWPQSRESLDYPEEVEAEAEEAGWKFNVPQTEFVHLRYRSSLDEVLRYASATASYGMSTAATKLPSTEEVIATLSKPCWEMTFKTGHSRRSSRTGISRRSSRARRRSQTGSGSRRCAQE